MLKFLFDTTSYGKFLTRRNSTTLKFLFDTSTLSEF
jgi:hypothetical protein